MAPFNPGIQPTNDPNYLNYSEGVRPQRNIEPTGQQPTTIHPTGVTQVDMSGAYAAKGIAEGIQGFGQELDLAGKEADTIVKKGIDAAIFKSLDAERNRYDTSLQALTQTGVNQAVRQGIYKSSSSVLPPITLAGVQGAVQGSSEASIPFTLTDTLPTQLQTVADAFESGKVSPTFYYGRLNEIAKQFRAQYPGYREYVDEKVKSITGVDPANAKITALTTQINNTLTQARASQNRLDSFFQRREVAELPGAKEVYAGVVNGTINQQQMYSWYSGYENIKYQRSEAKAQLETLKESVEGQKIIAEQKFNGIGVATVGTSMKSVELSAGVGNFNQVMNHLNDLAAGKAQPLSPEKYQALASHVMTYAEGVKKQLENVALTDGYAQILGPTKMNEMIEAHVKPMKEIANFIVNKELGPASLASRFTQAVKDGDTARMIGKNDPTANFIRKLQVFSAAGGSQNITSFPVIQDFINQSGLSSLGTYELDKVTDMGSQIQLKDTGVPADVRGVFDDMVKQGINNPQTFDKFLNVVSGIPEMKSEELQKNFAISMFNRGFLDMNWKNRDGSDIRPRIMDTMTAPKVRDVMWKLGQTDPKMWNMYTDWVTKSGVDIATRDIKDLNTIQMVPNVKIGWDNDNYKLSVLYKGAPVGMQDNLALLPKQQAPGPATLMQYQKKVDSINSFVGALAGIKKKTPGLDVENHLLRVLQISGWDINPDKVDNLPDAMITAIRAARAKQEKAK